MLVNNPLIQSVTGWFRRHFTDPAAVGLFFTLLFAVLIIEFFGGILLPLFVAVVIAYLLQAPVKLLTRAKVPHLFSVIIVFAISVGLFFFGLFTLIPLLAKQLSNLAGELPTAMHGAQNWMASEVRKYPRVFPDASLKPLTDYVQTQVSKIGPMVVNFSLTGLSGIITAVLYFILVPILVFFFLKDATLLISWVVRILPANRGLVLSVWSEVHQKIGAYVRGRVVEILIIAVMSSIVFAIMGLHYSILLGALVGLSVIIPYVGATVVTFPVVITALMQWGISPDLWYLVIAYALIITFDANILVPWLFSESMDLHPVVIIFAVVLFGAFWGFWGVFFAIPLATVIDAVLRAWPSTQEYSMDMDVPVGSSAHEN